ncbi:MAG: hypothetical protein QOJ29_3270 [Thermoleophilaceae bacterium]|jgi:hypothetical protein|nr:hypothetical protein [Thermoleophilaceae bacterium]
MAIPRNASSPWLFARATRQRGQLRSEPLPYDEGLQVTVIRDGADTVPAVERYPPPQTKKADIEKGEDQKDRW